MGTKYSFMRKSKAPSEVQVLFEQTYSKLKLDFTQNEITMLDMRFKDAKKYFYASFDYLLIFNTMIFTDNFQTLYDNFSKKIESFSKENKNKAIKVLLLIEDEVELLETGTKIEFEYLFTILFEKIEIGMLLYIDCSNNQYLYIRELILQMYQNATLYKFNRKFDCMYFLLPSTDYVIKNSCTISYLICKGESEVEKSNEIFNVVFKGKNFKKFLLSNAEIRESNKFYDEFLAKIKAIHSLTVLYVNFNLEESDFFLKNEIQFKLLETHIQNQRVKIFSFFLDKNFNFNKNFEIFMLKMLSLFDTCPRSVNCLKLKFLLNSNKDTFITETFYNKIEDRIKEHFCKKDSECIFKEQKNIFIFEITEIIGDKRTKCNFISKYSKYHNCKEEIIKKTNFKDKYRKSEEFLSLEKALKRKNSKLINNAPIMNTLKKFFSETKVSITEEKIISKNENFETGILKGVEYRNHIKKEYLNEI